MKKLEKQLKNWQELKGLCDELKLSRGLARKEILEEFYTGVKTYYETYRTKFDFENPPK